MTAATKSSHRRWASGVGLAGVLCALILSGCTSGQKDASNYDDTEEEFLAGCQAVASQDNESGAETQIAAPTSWCKCAFDAIVDEVPFAEFKAINSKLRDSGGPLPAAFQQAYESCEASTT